MFECFHCAHTSDRLSVSRLNVPFYVFFIAIATKQWNMLSTMENKLSRATRREEITRNQIDNIDDNIFDRRHFHVGSWGNLYSNSFSLLKNQLYHERVKNGENWRIVNNLASRYSLWCETCFNLFTIIWICRFIFSLPPTTLPFPELYTSHLAFVRGLNFPRECVV